MSVLTPNDLAYPPLVESQKSMAHAIPEVSAQRTNRFVLVDAFRVVCAAWVMWIHVPESATLSWTSELAPFRMPFFTLLAIFFLFRKLASPNPPRYGDYVSDRFRRLYLPFLGWATFYYIFYG